MDKTLRSFYTMYVMRKNMKDFNVDMYNKKSFGNKDYEKYEKWIEKQQYMRQEQQRQQLCIMRVRLDQKLQNSIEKHTSILVQLQSAYKELRNWKILGKRYIQKDI
ncbi:hypothetical protein RhiirB3_533301, partial [Rhizophagus irregularis]